MGECLRALGRTAEAISQYEQALALKAEFPEARFNLGMALQQAREWERAVVQYERVSHSHSGSAVVLATPPGEDPSAFEQQRGSGRSAVPDAVAREARVRQCDLLQGLDRREEARECLEFGLRQWPRDGHLYNELGDWYLASGRYHLSAGFYRSAIAFGFGSVAEINLALVAEVEGNVTESLYRYGRALQWSKERGLPHRHIQLKMAVVLPRIIPARAELAALRGGIEDRLDALLVLGSSAAGRDDTDNSEPLNKAFSTGYHLAFHGVNNRALKTKLARALLQFCPALQSGEFLREDNVMMMSQVVLKHTEPEAPGGQTGAPSCAGEGPVSGSGSGSAAHAAAGAARRGRRGGGGTREKVGRKIRVGFVSRFLHQHDVGRLLQGVIEQLSRTERFHVTVFAMDPADGDGTGGWGGGGGGGGKNSSDLLGDDPETFGDFSDSGGGGGGGGGGCGG
jgi:tetratricopeptide (TPR) repeat protein